MFGGTHDRHGHHKPHARHGREPVGRGTRGPVLARALVAPRRHQDRHHSAPGLPHPGDPPRRPRPGGRDQARRADHDRRAGHGRLHLRGDRQADSDPEEHRRRRDLRDLHPLGARLLRPGAAADGEGDHRLHQVHQLPLHLHRHDHRRLDPRHGSRRPDQGLPQDLRAAGDRLGGGGPRRHAGRHAAGPRPLQDVLLHRRADHGGRRRRGRDPALHRLRGDPGHAAGRRLRAGAAAGDARLSHRDHPRPARSTMSGSDIPTSPARDGSSPIRMASSRATRRPSPRRRGARSMPPRSAPPGSRPSPSTCSA